MNTEFLPSFASWTWHTSLAALPLALVVILFARWRGLAATWKWWLSALFFLRLAMPQVPEVAWPWARVPMAITESASGLPVSDVATATGASLPWLPVLWMLGSVAVLSWMFLSHWRLNRLIQHEALPADETMDRHAKWAAARMGLANEVPLLVMPSFTTMAVSGWWRPVVLIPADLESRFSGPQIRGMLLHEMAHIRRRDVLWTWLALWLCALHWFNPLAWLVLCRFHADRELACDAAALRALEPTARQDYGEALLLCLESPVLHAAPALAPFFRRFPELKQRLQNIMKPTSPTLRGRLVTALLIPTIAAVTFTTARAQRDGDAAKPASPDALAAERPARDGEKPKTEKRDGEGKPAARDGEGARDGEVPRKGPRDGEGVRKEGVRDGDQPRKGLRDGDQPKAGPRDGEAKKEGSRDGDQPRKGPRDGDQPKAGPRDGEVKKEGPRDGDQPRKGPRDGEQAKKGPRDGDAPKAGPRDGDAPKAGPRAGDAAKPARDGDRAKPEGEKPEAR